MIQYLPKQPGCCKCCSANRFVSKYIILLIMSIAIAVNANSQYLKRSLLDIHEAKADISTGSAHYRPVFGAGDDSSRIIRGISRYGLLVIDPNGTSNKVKYSDEEQVLFILEGTGILNWGNVEVPVSKNDFMYIPEETNYQFTNPREQALSVIVMGFKLGPDTCRRNTSELMISNTDEVNFQILASHGPTTQFQLLLGNTESTRDKLAVACQVTSLFIMDFAAGGTNNPHRHDNEEEIYLILNGHGDIVAGEKNNSGELRHPSNEGDVYYFSPETLIGFYSGNNRDEEHAKILAVRFNFPDPHQDSPR